MKQKCKRITITVRGKDEQAIDEAVREAARLILDGNVCGHNSNDTGAFYFDTTDSVPRGQLPA